MRARRHFALLDVVAIAGFAACTDATTSIPGSRISPTGVRMNVAVSRTAADARSLRVVAQYAREHAPTVLRPVDSVTAPLAAGIAAVSVLLDIGACLQDAERQRPQSGSSDKTCVLHLTLTLYDATMRMIDRSELTPIAATLGQPASTPDAVLGPRPIATNALALGPAHTCVLNDAGLLYCWGQNAYNFGTGDTISSLTPRLSGGGMRFTQIDASGSSVCGLALDRSVYCWGQGSASRPDPTAAVPIAPVAIPNLKFQSVAVGLLAACGIEDGTGAAYCWGNNRSGMLGVGDTLPRTTPVRVDGNLQFRAIRTAIFATCGLTSTTPPQVYCWGVNQSYRMISPNTTQTHYTVPTLIPLPANVTPAALTVGVTDVCILTTTGAMYCWGTDLFGNTSPGSGTRLLPAPNPAATSIAFAGISAARENSFLAAYGCGWTSDGAAYCWGANSEGQLGSSSSTGTCSLSTATSFPCANVPFPVAASVKFVSVVTGQEHTCGITSDHQLYCWGLNRNGQLGTGTTNATTATARAAASITMP